ncbi:uncharacterized protein LOC114738970 [Neltuma alba]|uniref:uncharacterized protein LOC114738970 n=1 Tax=Neltuma alba TaxID=207710 RepID=UPI0010A35CD8|nr:uncharacterized protein LOC114738970 [Prosopis alba]
MIRKGWNLTKNEDLEITDVDQNAFIFEFRRAEDRMRILKGRPWSIQGQLLNIQIWKDFMTFSEVDFHSCPFWIQFHDLPEEAMDIENVRILGSMVGNVVMIEDPRRGNLLTRSFLRARVVVDLRKPLITGIWTPRPDMDPVWIKIKYERLQQFCFWCGRIGHDQKHCPYHSDEEEDVSRRFGTWLSSPAARMITEQTICETMGWEEFEISANRPALTERSIIVEKEKCSKMKNQEGESRNLEVKKNKVTVPINVETSREIEKLIKPSISEIDARLDQETEVNKGGSEVQKLNSMKGEEGGQKAEENNFDITKAIVVYGAASPISDVMDSLKRIRLKRGMEFEEEEGVIKRRKLSFPDEPLECTQMPQEERVVKEGRRSVGAIKRQMRRSGNRRNSLIKGGGRSREKKGEDRMVLEELSMNDAEGPGGWPQTATKDQ